MICIYLITSKSTGKQYVGSTSNFFRRRKEHARGLRRGNHHCLQLQRIFDKYGEADLVMRVLEECRSKQLFEREDAWIVSLRPGLNTAPVAGSLLGLRHSDDTRARMSEAQKNRYELSGGSVLKGRKRPPETRMAISEGKKGKKFSPEHIANMSSALKGRISPRKGVVLTEETKAKISAGKAGKKQTPESVAKRAASLRETYANKIIKVSKETRLKISASQKNRKFSEETKKKMSSAARKRHAKKALEDAIDEEIGYSPSQA